MFLRKMGRRYLLLHSRRMGDGRVSQRRLCHFEEVAELRKQLDCPRWRADISQKHPGVTMNWDRLQQQAGQLPDSPPCLGRKQRIDQLKGNLLTLLREEGPDALRNLRSELDAHLDNPRMALPARRRRFEENEPATAAYFQGLESQAQTLHRAGRLGDSLALLQEWASASASPKAHLACGGALQQLGQLEAAKKHFGCLVRRDYRKHYQLAALACQQRNHQQALDHLLQGLLLRRGVGDALTSLWTGRVPVRDADYWHDYGHLWDEWSRFFFLAVYRQPLVRSQLSQLAERGVHVLKVLPDRVCQRLLRKILEPQLSGGSHVH